MATLQFQTFSSQVDVSFWQELSKKKLDEYKLDDKPQSIQGFYTLPQHDDMPSRLKVDERSFTPEERNEILNSGIPELRLVGDLQNFNTVEDFKKADKKGLMEAAAAKIWDAIVSGEAGEDPTLLNSFLLITFSDLKRHLFLYWFCFPAVVTPSRFVLESSQSIEEVFDPVEMRSFEDGLITLVREESPRSVPVCFLVFPPRNELGEEPARALEVKPLRAWTDLDEATRSRVYFGIFDPCSLPGNPGWVVRNYLLYLLVRYKIPSAKILCYRDRLPTGNTWAYPQRGRRRSVILSTNYTGEAFLPAERVQTAVGWEPNVRGKLGPRQMNLSPLMDPTKLAETSVDLNLKLMRWRQMPNLDTELLYGTKCLLLGAGTLGCNVGRYLLAWGIRHITFVDSGKVSFSNPARQSLFEFADCLDGGKPKALAAAEALRRIFPGVQSRGVQLSIPMPGHPITSSEVDGFRRDLATLQELVDEHDIVFLGTDSRESRWLPSVMAASTGKLLINVALGFDTFVVMRHGIEPSQPTFQANDDQASSKMKKLGCYFCNDVVAPENSLRDRTLDQMCTVTRPGLAPMASAIAVELAVSLLHHPQGICAAADGSVPVMERTSEAFGLVPHQIRGFLTHFSQLLVTGFAFDKCTACSPRVLESYQQGQDSFVLKACNDSSYLEQLTGLAELMKGIEDLEVDYSSAEEDFEE